MIRPGTADPTGPGHRDADISAAAWRYLSPVTCRASRRVERARDEGRDRRVPDRAARAGHIGRLANTGGTTRVAYNSCRNRCHAGRRVRGPSQSRVASDRQRRRRLACGSLVHVVSHWRYGSPRSNFRTKASFMRVPVQAAGRFAPILFLQCRRLAANAHGRLGARIGRRAARLPHLRAGG